MKNYKKLFPLLLIIAFSIIAWALGIHHYFTFDFFKTHQESLELFIAHNSLLSALIYIISYITVVGISIPGATFMTLIGGFLFGQWIGTCYAVFSATIGATLLFLSTRMASVDLLEKKAGSWAKKMQQGFQENAFSYLLTLRLIPIFPFVAVNLVAAFAQISLRTFFLGTLFGIIPGSFVYVSMGVALHEVIQKPNFSPNIVLNPKILMALVGLGLLSLLPVLYKHLKKEDLNHDL